MKWMKALKWAFPLWLVMMSIAGALMFLTGFVAEVGAAEAWKRFCILLVVALPLIAFVIKATCDDFAAYLVAFWNREK